MTEKEKDVNAFSLINILDWSPESVFEIMLPSVEGMEDVIRLKRIIYRALYFLKTIRQRSKAVLLAAWEDILMLQDWCLTHEMNEAMAASEGSEQDEAALSHYIDQNRYANNIKRGVELYYLGITDVLQEITLQYSNVIETPCELTSTDFTNAEFLCVAALYNASTALQKLQRIYNLLLNNNTLINRSILWELKQATNDTLEAQLAIELANLYDKLSSGDFEAVFKAMLAEQQRQRSLQGNHMRWNQHKIRREKAWELFNQYKQEHPDLSDVKIIAQFIDEIQLLSDKLGIDRLKAGSEIDSIYKMIYQKRSEKKDK